jgi:predicted nucleotidyltransferase
MTENRKLAEEFSRYLKAKYGDRIERIILFGSVARGDDRQDSDVDLLVVALGDWFALQRELAGDAVDWLLRSGVYLSTKVFSREDFARLQGTGFGRKVIAEGVPLA